MSHKGKPALHVKSVKTVASLFPCLLQAFCFLCLLVQTMGQKEQQLRALREGALKEKMRKNLAFRLLHGSSTSQTHLTHLFDLFNFKEVHTKALRFTGLDSSLYKFFQPALNTQRLYR